MKPKLAVFASGTPDGGGSGFENLVTSPDLNVDIVAVISTHERGGVRERAERLGIPFIYFAGPYTTQGYTSVLQKTAIGTDGYVALSGWMRRVEGLDPKRTINIHPALLSEGHGRFGGVGMYGHHIHEAVKTALDAGEIAESGFTMHFVTEEIDRGPTFFEYRVPLEKGMSADDIATAVNKEEHRWQPRITNMVVHGEIRWDGRNVESLAVPANFT